MSTAVYVVFATRTLELDWLPDDTTVVLVHNDDSFDRASISRPVVHVESGGNIGFGAAANRALPFVTGPRLVLCNPDLALTGAHWDALSAGAPDEVVTVPLVDDDGLPTSVCSAYPTPLSHLASGYRLGRWFPRGSRARTWAARALGKWGDAHDASLTRPAGEWSLSDRWVSGAALSVDVARFSAVGGFDERYFLYLEDVDLCRRLASSFANTTAVVADVAPGVHAVGASATGDSRRVERFRLDSAIRYADQRALDQRGLAWRGCALALRIRTWWLR